MTTINLTLPKLAGTRNSAAEFIPDDVDGHAIVIDSSAAEVTMVTFIDELIKTGSSRGAASVTFTGVCAACNTDFESDAFAAGNTHGITVLVNPPGPMSLFEQFVTQPIRAVQLTKENIRVLATLDGVQFAPATEDHDQLFTVTIIGGERERLEAGDWLVATSTPGVWRAILRNGDDTATGHRGERFERLFRKYEHRTATPARVEPELATTLPFTTLITLPRLLGTRRSGGDLVPLDVAGHHIVLDASGCATSAQGSIDELIDTASARGAVGLTVVNMAEGSVWARYAVESGARRHFPVRIQSAASVTPGVDTTSQV
jgi:hypothetical protein